MIIGISGKIKSGKDTVGRIIQTLTSRTLPENGTVIDHLEYEQLYLGGKFPTSDWEIKKYADKLKDIVCLLLGCTREQLEDREFKEKPLGSQWDMYKLYWSDGWDTQVSIVTENFDKDLYLDKKGVFNGGLRDKITLTPRKILQLLGTKAGRQIIHPNIWVNALMSSYISYSARGSEYEFEEDKWIITDMRFPNELDAVKNKNGVTIRINRPETDHLAGDHLSETALDNSEFDHIITNDGTLEELIEKVRLILLQRGII